MHFLKKYDIKATFFVLGNRVRDNKDLIKREYNYIKKVDIWNYLKINKWCKDKNLTISEMVNDIIEADVTKVDLFLKKHLKEEERKAVE